MISNDLAGLYGVTTKRLNEQVKRSIIRFTQHFMFQLTEQEKDKPIGRVVKNYHRLSLDFYTTKHGNQIPDYLFVKLGVENWWLEVLLYQKHIHGFLKPILFRHYLCQHFRILIPLQMHR